MSENRFEDAGKQTQFTWGCWYEIERSMAKGLWIEVLIIGRCFGCIKVMYLDGRLGWESVSKLSGWHLLTKTDSAERN